MAAACAVALALTCGAASANAATLRAEYRFRGNLASEVPRAPDLVNIGRGNRFAFERINGLGRHSVLRFPEGNGLSLTNAGLVDPTDNSVVMVFRLAATDGYRRILDFAGGTSDHGLYNLDGHLVIYGGNGGSDRSQEAILTHSFTQVALTNAAAAGGAEQVTAYLNGDQVAATKVSSGFDLSSGEFRFFRDNRVGPFPGEESSGAVSCILVFDGTLSADEVSSVSRNPALCPAPKPTLGRAEASAGDRPTALRMGNSVVVDTGLTVTCPAGATRCAASGQVDEAPSRQSAGRSLGTVRFSVPAGESKPVRVRLTAAGVRALRDAGTLKVRVLAEIKPHRGKIARVQQVGTIEAPKLPAFRSGTYTGTTSQELPIILSVHQTAVRSALFRWRSQCDDGKTHTGTIVLSGRARVQHGRFTLNKQLDSGGTARVTGKLKGVRASGTLMRKGKSASGTRCAVELRWHARTSSVEVGTSG